LFGLQRVAPALRNRREGRFEAVISPNLEVFDSQSALASGIASRPKDREDPGPRNSPDLVQIKTTLSRRRFLDVITAKSKSDWSFTVLRARANSKA